MPKFTPDEITKFTSDWKTFMATIPQPPAFKGRGVVYTCYPQVLTETLRSIRFLRHYNCTLPVEVFHHSGELNEGQIKQLESIPGVVVKDLAKLAKDGVFSFNRPSDPNSRFFAVKGGALIQYQHLKKLIFRRNTLPRQRQLPRPRPVVPI
jgi:Mannosyltransferase putative